MPQKHKVEKIKRNTEPYIDMDMHIKMKKWLEKEYNVMFRGLHGIGKTVSAVSFLESNNIKYRYFSCSTLNPWLHFIGLPKENVRENGEYYIDYILPDGFDNNIEVIILDEFNRAKKEIKNAVMELLQFKSINGRKFKNLKMIIACCNPHFDDKDRPESLEYDVESIDPAQEDRFQIQIDLPYKPNKKYLSHVYNEDIAEKAVGWWETLSKEQQYSLSPRRLDLMLEHYYSGEDIGEMVKKDIKDSFLKSSSVVDEDTLFLKMSVLFKSNDIKKSSELAKNDTRVINVLRKYASNNKLWSEIDDKQNWVNFWFKSIPAESFSSLFYEQSNIRKAVMSSNLILDYAEFLTVFCAINKSSTEPSVKLVIQTFESLASSNSELYKKISDFESKNQSLSYFRPRN